MRPGKKLNYREVFVAAHAQVLADALGSLDLTEEARMRCLVENALGGLTALGRTPGGAEAIGEIIALWEVHVAFVLPNEDTPPRSGMN